MTVVSVDEQERSSLTDLELPPGLATKTPIFVTYIYAYAGDQPVKSVSVFGNFEPCEPISSIELKQLAAGQTVERCVIFHGEGTGLGAASFRNLDWVVT